MSLSAISLAFLSPGLNPYYAIAPLFKQNISFKAIYKISKLFSSIIILLLPLLKINDLGVNTALYSGITNDNN
jgi:hypothetical protein